MSSTEVQPIADNFAERCKCTTLTIKYFIVIVRHLRPLTKRWQQWLYVLYYPSLGFFTERCNCYLLPTKYFIVIAAELLPLSFFRQWVVRSVQPIASKCDERCISATLTIKWYLFVALDNKIGALNNLGALLTQYRLTQNNL